MDENRVPVALTLYDENDDWVDPARRRTERFGMWATVAWDEHKKAFDAYLQSCVDEGDDTELGDTATEVARRGGFTYWELKRWLGHAPETWKLR